MHMRAPSEEPLFVAQYQARSPTQQWHQSAFQFRLLISYLLPGYGAHLCGAAGFHEKNFCQYALK